MDTHQLSKWIRVLLCIEQIRQPDDPLAHRAQRPVVPPVYCAAALPRALRRAAHRGEPARRRAPAVARAPREGHTRHHSRVAQPALRRSIRTRRISDPQRAVCARSPCATRPQVRYALTASTGSRNAFTFERSWFSFSLILQIWSQSSSLSCTNCPTWTTQRRWSWPNDASRRRKRAGITR